MPNAAAISTAACHRFDLIRKPSGSGVSGDSGEIHHALGDPDRAVLVACHEVYIRARASKLPRWSGATRDRTPRGAVTLNPERDAAIDGEVFGRDRQAASAGFRRHLPWRAPDLDRVILVPWFSGFGNRRRLRSWPLGIGPLLWSHWFPIKKQVAVNAKK